MQSKKRFIEINIWECAWFTDLSLKKKLFWIYLNNRCDNIGVWSPNLRLLSFHLKIDNADIERFIKEFFDEVNSCEQRIKILKSGSWLLIDFVQFQYCKSKGLNPKNPAHRSYLELMKSQKLFSWFCENQPEVLPEYELKKYLDSRQKAEVNKTSKRPLLEVSESYKDTDTDTDSVMETDTVTETDTDSNEEPDVNERTTLTLLDNSDIKKNNNGGSDLLTRSFHSIASDLLSIYPKQTYQIFFEEQIKCEDTLKSLIENGFTLHDAVMYIAERITEIRETGGSLVGLLDGIMLKMENKNSAFKHPSSLGDPI